MPVIQLSWQPEDVHSKCIGAGATRWYLAATSMLGTGGSLCKCMVLFVMAIVLLAFRWSLLLFYEESKYFNKYTTPYVVPCLWYCVVRAIFPDSIKQTFWPSPVVLRGCTHCENRAGWPCVKDPVDINVLVAAFLWLSSAFLILVLLLTRGKENLLASGRHFFCSDIYYIKKY